MKNLFGFFVFALLLLVACNSSTLNLPSVKPEMKMTLTVSLDIVHPGDTVTVFWTTENADQTTNNFGAPDLISGSYKLVVNDKTTVSVTAIGGGKSITESRTISLSPIIIPVVKTAKDTLISSPWTFIQTYFSLDKITWAEESYLDAVKGRIYNFSANNTMTIFNPPFSSSDLRGPIPYTIDGRTLTINGISFEMILTDKRLELYLKAEATTETGAIVPCWHKEDYTRL